MTLLQLKEMEEMAKTIYTVTVESADQYEPEYEVRLENEEKAIEQAETWATEHKNKLVFVKFQRASDGQVGFINRDGADLTGQSWTE